MTRTNLTLLASLLALLAAPGVRAEVYKWVDDKGVVNYGTTPPPGKAAKQLPAGSPGVTVVPGEPVPAPAPAPAKSATDERVERLEKALAAEKAQRESKEQSEDSKRRAAIAQCEANRGVDCDEDPYQQLNGGYGYGYVVPPRAVVRPRPIHAHDPSPPPPVKPKPPEKERPTSGALKPLRSPDEKK